MDDTSLVLPNFAGETFGIYLQWLLTGKLHSKAKPVETVPGSWGNTDGMLVPIDSLHSALFEEIPVLQELHRLASYLVDVDFTDTLVDALIQCCAELEAMRVAFPMSHMVSFYTAVTEDLDEDEDTAHSPTRRLIVDLTAWLVDDIEQLRKLSPHPEFVMELMLAFGSRFVYPSREKLPIDGWETSCKYHCHGDMKPCYRSKVKTYATPF
jgi:hypothetical protein